MQNALHIKTKVLPGGKIEVTDQALSAGEEVDVIVLLPEPPTAERQSAIDILAEAPGHRLFKTASDVEDDLQQGRDAWNR